MDPQLLQDVQNLLNEAFQEDHNGKRHLKDANGLYDALSELLAVIAPLLQPAPAPAPAPAATAELGRKGGEAKPDATKEEPKKKEK
jgi:hypothetical protein